MLSPKRVHHTSQQRRRSFSRRLPKSGYTSTQRRLALQCLQTARITPEQLEAARVCIRRCLNKSGKIWMRVFPNVPITKKPIETRMGKGKGNIAGWASVVQPGRILIEVGEVEYANALLSLRSSAYKLPTQCQVVRR